MINLDNIRKFTIAIVMVLITMTLISVYNYPENLGKYGITSFEWTISLLVVYLIFSIRMPVIGSKLNYRIAIEEGTYIGFIAGIIWIIHVTIEYFVSLPQGLNGIVTLSFMGILFIFFGVSAYRTMQKTKQITSSLLSGVWCAMLSILILFFYGFILNFVFMSRLMTILHFDEEFKMSGMSLASFTIHNTIESGGTHLLEAPIIALIFSLLGIGFLKIQKLFYKTEVA